MDEKNSIFDLEGKFQLTTPFDNWMKPREEALEIEKQIKLQGNPGAEKGSKESPYESGDIFIFNYDELFLVRNYGESNQKVLWRTKARSGNGKYLNNPEYSHVKYDEKKHLGGPIPPGWFYLDLSDFEADKDSSNGQIKDGTNYKGYQPNRCGGAWGEWAKNLWPYGFWSWSWSSTDTKGRDGFFLHEDGNERDGGPAVGSGGCIATTLDGKGITLVMRDVKKAYELGDTYIDLLADQAFKVEDPEPPYFYHLVVENDTLYSLSRKYRVSIKEIQKANKMKNTVIKKGTRIKIPISFSLFGWD